MCLEKLKSLFGKRKKAENFIEKEESVFEDLLYVLLGMFIAFVLYHALAFALKTPDPIVTVVSCSMLPTIHRGDLLIVEHVSFNQIVAGRRNGTIIVYRAPNGMLIVHRVWKKYKNGTLWTWGDNNPFPDPWKITMKDVIGKVVYIIPKLGYPKLLIAEALGDAPRSC